MADLKLAPPNTLEVATGIKYVINTGPSKFYRSLGWREMHDTNKPGNYFYYYPPTKSSSATIDARVGNDDSDKAAKNAQTLEVTNQIIDKGELNYKLIRALKCIFTLGYGFGYFQKNR